MNYLKMFRGYYKILAIHYSTAGGYPMSTKSYFPVFELTYLSWVPTEPVLGSGLQ